MEDDPLEDAFGALQFTLFGPLNTEFTNYVRSISLVREGGRWHWNVNGTQQWFEEAESYESRDVAARFTIGQLARYCAALGVHPFEAAAYGKTGVLIDSHQVVPVAKQFSLDQARQL